MCALFMNGTMLAGMFLIVCSIFTNAPWIFLGGMSVVTFINYGMDKMWSMKRQERLPERYLWFISFAGGAAGALVAMLLFRHKVNKKSFYMPVVLMFILHAFICVSILRYY